MVRIFFFFSKHVSSPESRGNRPHPHYRLNITGADSLNVLTQWMGGFLVTSDAIQQSIQLFLTDCVKSVKTTKTIQYPLYSALVCHGTLRLIRRDTTLVQRIYSGHTGGGGEY